IAGNTGFNESIHYVEKILQKAGFVQENKGEADGPLTYRIEKRKMKGPTWEAVDASVWLGNETQPLLTMSSNRNMIAIHSASTPANGETAELVFVGKGSVSDFEKQDVKGKIVLGETATGALYNRAMQRGALGVMGYSMPAYTEPQKYIHSIQFQGIPYTDSLHQKWGIALSYDAYTRLKAALAKGTVQVRVKVQTRIYPSTELTLVANVRGETLPDERFVFSAHVQEPGANDNATGVGTLAEMARVTAELVHQKKIHPQRTLTFLWGDEIISTRRYIADDPIRAKGIKWGLSLDMVGEDVSKTTGSFLIEKMPDPSAIWTRGADKHTEWGGSKLSESDMFPHYFNDFLLNRCMQQSRFNGWVVHTNPFEGGSDHTPFLQAKIPGLLMWHFTDVFYHTDADRLDKVSPAEMKNVGVSGLAAAYTLCSASESTTLSLIAELEKNAIERLQTEWLLSKTALQQGAAPDSEKHILQVWSDWYQKAVAKMNEIATSGDMHKIQQVIDHSVNTIRQKERELVSKL
ncbi:MAG: M28 family peptidase, partial [Bacteroidota bacterium]|nr:M28 family peptidase [Bacteroidota bacterium]